MQLQLIPNQAPHRVYQASLAGVKEAIGLDQPEIAGHLLQRVPADVIDPLLLELEAEGLICTCPECNGVIAVGHAVQHVCGESLVPGYVPYDDIVNRQTHELDEQLGLGFFSKPPAAPAGPDPADGRLYAFVQIGDDIVPIPIEMIPPELLPPGAFADGTASTDEAGEAPNEEPGRKAEKSNGGYI
jgi:hypothetical protein